MGPSHLKDRGTQWQTSQCFSLNVVSVVVSTMWNSVSKKEEKNTKSVFLCATVVVVMSHHIYILFHTH